MRGNLDAGAGIYDGTVTPPTGGTASTTINVYDTLGVRHSIKMTFTKTGAGAWAWAATPDPTDTQVTAPSVATPLTGTVTFDANGALTASTGSPLAMTLDGTLTTATPPSIAIDFKAMTQFSGSSDIAGATNGFTSGQLTTFTVGNGGEITGVYSNGQTQKLGQIAMAAFLNPSGLLRAGQNSFTTSSASGDPAVGIPGSGGRGEITTGALEMSNVDLATQFTGMITAERGFQANGRVITTSDEMLQTLVNLKQ
jgi:flagellar hook protein FlgE